MLRIRELREQRHLNQEGLAQRINVSQSTVSAYETGERTPDLDTLINLADFFDVSIDYLVGRSASKRHLSQSDLNTAEQEHLVSYRRLTEIQQQRLLAYMEGLLER